MNEIFCSTGVMIGRINNNDYTLIEKHFPDLYKNGFIDGGEFMFAHSFYDKLPAIYNVLSKIDVPFKVIHCDKEIGIMLSECNNSISKDALSLLELNCKFGESIGAKRAVLHLWGAQKSDSHIEYNISFLEQILEIFEKYGIEPLIENIPCTTHSGLENWKIINSKFPHINFIFDTRFGAFHDEIEATLSSPLSNKIKHIHISDYSSTPRDFSKIRPILHPGEGVINFDALFNGLKRIKYNGTFTLESPVMEEGFTNIKKLKSTLENLKQLIKNHAL